MVVGRVLGPLELSGPGGALRPRGSRQGVLLGGLLLRHGETVPVPELLHWLWEQTPPHGAKDALYMHLMRLRKALRKVAGDLVGVVNDGGGYRIDLGPGVVDADVFRALVAEARRYGAEGLRDTAVERLSRAEDLWRGDVLEGLPVDRRIQERITELHEERGAAAELRNDLDAALGRYRALVPRLRALVSRYPSRERLWWQLMHGLYQEGRQVEALECYREARTLLLEEYGLEPGADLDRLHRQILEHRVPADAGGSAPADRGATDDGWTAQCQLPADPAGLVGRDTETEAIERALLEPTGRSPVVVVSGPPGMGKSAVAVRVGHRLRGFFPDGQWHVRPAEGGGAGDRVGELLLLSGVHPGRIPASTPARTAALRARLAGRRVLIVVDGVRDLADVLPLLPGTPGCAVIVTGALRLTDLDGAERVALGPLGHADSTRLLAAHLGAARVGREPDAAREIADLCCGNPLALGIAATRLARRPDARLQVFADRLRDRDRRVDELAVGRRRVRSALDAVYRGLNPDTRHAFRLLGLVATDEYASWVLAALLGCDDAERSIEELVESSVLVPTGDDGTGEPRYRMHGLLQLHAASVAERGPAAEAAIRRLVMAHLQIGRASLRERPRVVWGQEPGLALRGEDVLPRSTVDRLVRVPLGWEQSDWRLGAELVERACDLGLHAEAARLSTMMCMPPGPHAERMYETVRRAAREAGDGLTAARVEFALARHLVYQRPRQMTARLRDCLDGFGRLGARRERVHALVWLAIAASTLGHDREAREYALWARSSIGADGAAHDPRVAAFVRALATPPDDPDLPAVFDRAWRSAEALGDPGLQWTMLHWYSGVAGAAGLGEEALRAARRGLELCASSSEPQAVAAILVRMARVHLSRGESTDAEVVAERAWRVLTADDGGDGIGVACELFGELLEAGIRLPAGAA